MKKALAVFTILSVSFSGLAADWSSSYANDNMRGTSQKFLQTESDNAVNFDFPYNGGSKMGLLFRSKKIQLKDGQKPEDLPLSEAILTISKGQFLCSSYDDCHVSVKFDDEKIIKFFMSPAKGGRADIIFFEDSMNFLKKVESHKKLIVEADFYESGPEQFNFDLSGFAKNK